VLLHRKEASAEILGALQAEGGERRQATKWDPRIYGIGALILREVGVGKMKLLASPRRMPSMAGFDLEVTGYLSPAEAGV
jgi:3,4-dihydroxy 2-butanone 4-phosphate synthase/GTP cyclohydrolase II